MTPGDSVDWLRVNRANWDERAVVHASGELYDLAGFRAGRSTLRPFELAEIGDVTGRSLVHLQCHLGQDTLSWARQGAEVTGLDFSAQALGIARGLAAEAGLEDRARFVEADVYEAGKVLDERRFDIVYTGPGALVWLPDLDRWAAVAASLVADGGFVYLAEYHPLTGMLGVDGRTLERDYFDRRPMVVDEGSGYAGRAALENRLSVQWHHTLGEIVTALAGAGLRIEFLHEHPAAHGPGLPALRRDAFAGCYTPLPGDPQIPLVYSLRATRSSTRDASG